MSIIGLILISDDDVEVRSSEIVVDDEARDTSETSDLWLELSMRIDGTFKRKLEDSTGGLVTVPEECLIFFDLLELYHSC